MIIVEDGSGLINSNSYASIAETDQYMSARYRSAWSEATEQQKTAALIAATDYMEARFGYRFLGQRKFPAHTRAWSVLSSNGKLEENTSITVGDVTIEIPVGATRSAEFNALKDALLLSGLLHTRVSAYSFAVYAQEDGIAGNEVTVTTTDAEVLSWSVPVMQGGSHVPESQALSFPRTTDLAGINRNVVKACMEYAERALIQPLAPDPEFGPSGQVVARSMQRIGPIEEEYSYLRNVLVNMRAYPLADNMLKPVLGPIQGSVYV